MGSQESRDPKWVGTSENLAACVPVPEADDPEHFKLKQEHVSSVIILYLASSLFCGNAYLEGT